MKKKRKEGREVRREGGREENKRKTHTFSGFGKQTEFSPLGPEGAAPALKQVQGAPLCPVLPYPPLLQSPPLRKVNVLISSALDARASK